MFNREIRLLCLGNRGSTFLRNVGNRSAFTRQHVSCDVLPLRPYIYRLNIGINGLAVAWSAFSSWQYDLLDYNFCGIIRLQFCYIIIVFRCQCCCLLLPVC